MMQLAAVYHNKSCCHEYNGERTAALQASEKGLALAQKLGLPDDHIPDCVRSLLHVQTQGLVLTTGGTL